MERILVIKFGALGDVVMATPLVEAVLNHHHSDEVSLLTTPAFAPIFAPWSRLTVRASARRGAVSMLALLRWLRATRFDRIYDLQGNTRTGLLCRLSGSALRVGNHAGRNYTHHPTEPWRGQCHIFTRMCAVLASAGVTVSAQQPLLPAGANEVRAVDDWLARHASDERPLALLHAGASPTRPEKRWPYFTTLAGRLRAAGYRVVWLGSIDDAVLNDACRGGDDLDASGAFDILALAEFGRRAAFAVTNDSGPMHVLAASGIPVFGLFGPSDWRRNHALGQVEQVITVSENRPQSRGTGARGDLRALTVDAVWARLCASGVVTA